MSELLVGAQKWIPRAQALGYSPDVEQHPAENEELEALAQRSLAAPSIGHRASLRARNRALRSLTRR